MNESRTASSGFSGHLAEAVRQEDSHVHRNPDSQTLKSKPLPLQTLQPKPLRTLGYLELEQETSILSWLQEAETVAQLPAGHPPALKPFTGPYTTPVRILRRTLRIPL